MIGIAGVQGLPGDTGEGSFIFSRYVSLENRTINTSLHFPLQT